MLLIITILLLEVLAVAELDIFIPSFPEIREQFALSPFSMQFALSLNFVFYCIFSLVFGIVGDRCNRKKVIIYTLLIFILGSLISALADRYSLILLGRVLQGIGIAGPATLAYVIIADTYSPERQVTLLGWLHSILGFATAAAPVLGSYITYHYGWRGNFIALLALGIFCIIFSMAHIKPGVVQANSASLSFVSYTKLLSSRKVMLYTLALCFYITPYIVFIGVSSMLYIQDFGVSLEDFSIYQGALAFVFASSSAASGFIIQRLGQRKCLQISMIMCFTHIVALSLIVMFNVKNPLLITASMALASAGTVFPINILYPYALEVVGNAKGRISALMMAVRLIFSAIGLWLVGYFYNGTFIPVGIWVISNIGISVILTIILMRAESSLFQNRTKS